MRRLFILGIVAGLLTACGIGPGQVEKNGSPLGNEAGVNETAPRDLNRTENFNEPIRLVDQYLEAAAADQKDRETTLRSFLPPGEEWGPPGSVINVVHVLEPKTLSPLRDKITVRIQHIGILDLNLGQLRPSERGEETLDFAIVEVPGKGLFLRPPRPELLFSDTGLQGYFDARPIYFWAKTGAETVPDLRYVPKYISEEEKATRLVKWLYLGPAPWLDATVLRLPETTQPSDRVTIDQDRTVIVNLSTQPAAGSLQQIAAQMAKTLAVASTSGLLLKIQGQVQGQKLPPLSVSTLAPRKSYAVVKGVVQLVSKDAARVGLLDEVNKNVLAVAFTQNETAAMVVHPDGAVGQRLSIGLKNSQLTPVTFQGLSRPNRISQPVWLRGQGRSGLVLADGKLFQVTMDGKAVHIPSTGGLTAFSVAPDGRRIAMVIGGRLRLAALIHEKGGVSLGPELAIVPTLLTEVQSVAFGSPIELVVAGQDATATQVLTMNIDGTQQSPSRKSLDRTLRITHLVSDGRSANSLYEIESLGSWRYQFSGAQPLKDLLPPGLVDSDVHAPSFEGLED